MRRHHHINCLLQSIRTVFQWSLSITRTGLTRFINGSPNPQSMSLDLIALSTFFFKIMFFKIMTKIRICITYALHMRLGVTRSLCYGPHNSRYSKAPLSINQVILTFKWRRAWSWTRSSFLFHSTEPINAFHVLTKQKYPFISFIQFYLKVYQNMSTKLHVYVRSFKKLTRIITCSSDNVYLVFCSLQFVII